jgi:hypothetical protein
VVVSRADGYVFFIRAGQFLVIAGFFWYLFFPKEKYFVFVVFGL